MDLSQALTSELDKIELLLFDNEISRIQLHSEDARDIKLQQVVRSFNKPPRLRNLSTILSDYEFSKSTEGNPDTEWFVLARAATVIVSNLLDELFSRTLPLGQDIMYWEHLLSSRVGRALYMIQTAPSRVWTLALVLVGKLRWQLQTETLTMGTIRGSIFNGALLKRIAFPHLTGKNVESATQLLSVETMVRQEIRKKIDILSGLRDAQAQSIGVLVAKASIGSPENLSLNVDYLTRLLETSLLHSSRQYTAEQNTRFAAPQGEPPSCPQDVADRLIMLSKNFRHRRSSFIHQLNKNTRPSAFSRYWPVAVGLYIAGNRALTYLTNSEDQIKSWLHELSDTITSFWTNWIVGPTTRILATIRHDEGSEVALLSSRSLSADLESLERMVVEFAQDNPQYTSAASLQSLKESARNGDLTPVLVAYESNIKSPLRSAITGSLIRALLIQIQKTKVDVEVAINGIDKLLKSQELVFGFVGVSPALALVWIAMRWFLTLGGRRGRESSSQLRLNNIKVLRNIDRLLYKSSEEDSLTYKRRGLVLCEAQLLRANAGCITSELRDQYLQDVSDLERAADLEGLRSILRRIFKVYAGSLSYP